VPFERILVAIDGSDCSNRAFAKALELAGLTRAHLTALAIEGPLPAYAATIGEVEEVKREKDLYFDTLATSAREQAASAAITLQVEVRPGHPAELISRIAAEGQYDLVILGHRGHFLRDPPARLHRRPRG
jgi:nucleotide-binding universal stress UspA family protein